MLVRECLAIRSLVASVGAVDSCQLLTNGNRATKRRNSAQDVNCAFYGKRGGLLILADEQCKQQGGANC